MNNYYSVFIFILLAGIVISCEKDKEDETDENNMIIEALGNNSAILEGKTIGDSTENIDDLRKIIDVELIEDSNDFYIDKAYICRPSSLASHICWIIPVENISENPLVFIKANNIQFKNSQLILIGSDEEKYVYGEFGQDNLIYTTTFLPVNGKGYFVGIKEISFDEVTKIEINNIESGTNNFHSSSIKVIPLSYELTGNKIIIKVKNKSKETVYAIISPYILLDYENLPLLWDYLEPVTESINTGQVIEISAGEIVNFEGYNNYKGKCNRILTVIEFGMNPY
jgi:hypothetical protein